MTISDPLSASLRQRLLDLRDTRNAVRTLDPSTPDIVHRALARYLVVRSTGYLEAVRDDVADHFTSRKGSEEVVRRIRLHLRNGQGVAPTQLLEFARSFHPNWHEELNGLLSADDDRLKDLLGAMVSARKKIAHGDGETVTTARALAWADAAEAIGKWLTKRFDPGQPVLEPVHRRPG